MGQCPLVLLAFAMTLIIDSRLKTLENVAVDQIDWSHNLKFAIAGNLQMVFNYK